MGHFSGVCRSSGTVTRVCALDISSVSEECSLPHDFAKVLLTLEVDALDSPPVKGPVCDVYIGDIKLDMMADLGAPITIFSDTLYE